MQPCDEEDVTAPHVVENEVVEDIDQALHEQLITYDFTTRYESQLPIHNHPPSELPFVNRLPNELLTTIFAMRRDNDPRYSNNFKESCVFYDTSLSWADLMLVCRHWRAVGISSPWLWRQITVKKNMKVLRFRLSRAASCTIDVRFNQDPRKNKRAIPLLLPFAPYIRSIETPRHYFPFKGLSSIKPLFQVPLPALEYVELATEGGRLFDLGLSGELHPRLRRLEIYQFMVSPLPLSLSTLQELAINVKDLGNSTLARLTPESLVDVLVHSPQLVSLSLFFSPLWGYSYPLDCPSGSRRPEDLGPPTYTRRCRLPRLRKIDFRCPYLFASSVLTELDAPAVTFFHLVVTSRSIVEPFEIAERLFPPSLRNTADGKTALFVEFMGEHGFGIRDFKPRTKIAWHEKDPRNQLSFHYFDLTETLHPLDAALSTLCTAFPTTSLQSLDIFGFTSPPTGAVDGAWMPLFTTFPTLSSLVLNNHPEVVCFFLRTFTTLTTQSPTVPWPALRSLHINTGRCSCDGIYNPCRPITSDEAHLFFEDVLGTVRARAEREVPLAKFLFEPSVRRWCGVAAHRWILYSISLLCGEFELHSEGHGRSYYRSGFWDLFSAAERRRLSENPQDSEATTADGTSANSLDARKTKESADSKLEDESEATSSPESTIGDRAKEGEPVPERLSGVPEICECDLCLETLSIRSDVLQELLDTVLRLDLEEQ